MVVFNDLRLLKKRTASRAKRIIKTAPMAKLGAIMAFQFSWSARACHSCSSWLLMPVVPMTMGTLRAKQSSMDFCTAAGVVKSTTTSGSASRSAWARSVKRPARPGDDRRDLRQPPTAGQKLPALPCRPHAPSCRWLRLRVLAYLYPPLQPFPYIRHLFSPFLHCYQKRETLPRAPA